MSELTAFDLPLGPRTEAAYASGQVLADRYELTRVIGHGGTAVVWVARDSVLDVDVAAKIVLPSRSDLNSELKERTVQEARLCAQLTDAAVCRVLDFGFTRRGDPFVISELLEGETFDDRLIRERRLAPIEAVRLLLPILDALGAAHKKGIIHRDVKPANVFLSASDGRIQPKLLDFGIACSLDVRSRMTMTGEICGTPCYMSPEQALGRSDVDHRSDLWSFCVMLYESVTGTAPFFNDNCNATLFAITSQAAPPLVSLGFDEVLSRIVERGMSKERDARWPSAAELANALSRWLVQQGFESDVAGLSLRRRFLESGAPAVLLDLEESSGERADTLDPKKRHGWALPIAVASTLAAIGVLTLVALSARKSALPPSESVHTVVARPEPAPPLPISENVRTEQADPPSHDDAAADAGASSGAAATPPRVRQPSRRVSKAKSPEPPLFPATSPFTPSGSAPAGASADKARAPAPSAKLPSRSRSRAGGAPGRDYGI